MGSGFPQEPGIPLEYLKLASMTADSVCPKPSRISSPVCSLNIRKTSAFNASPAVVQLTRELKSYASRFSLIRKRYIVGGAQKVVILYFASSGRISVGVNLP